MPTMFIVAVAAMGLVLVVLAVVVAGIRQEPPAQELTRQAPRLMARVTRRLLGVYVRRPDPSVITAQQRGEPSHASGPARPPDRAPGTDRLHLIALPAARPDGPALNGGQQGEARWITRRPPLIDLGGRWLNPPLGADCPDLGILRCAADR